MLQPISYYSRNAAVLIFILISGCVSNPTDKNWRSTDVKIRNPNLNAAYNKTYTVFGVTYHPLRTAAGYNETGIASWYGSESGNTTAMGVRFNPGKMTAAHKTLPLPSRVRVTNLQNGRQIEVIVNDRGPFKKGRIIDLSHGAAKKIGLKGVAKVKVEHIDRN